MAFRSASSGIADDSDHEGQPLLYTDDSRRVIMVNLFQNIIGKM